MSDDLLVNPDDYPEWRDPLPITATRVTHDPDTNLITLYLSDGNITEWYGMKDVYEDIKRNIANTVDNRPITVVHYQDNPPTERT